MKTKIITLYICCLLYSCSSYKIGKFTFIQNKNDPKILSPKEPKRTTVKREAKDCITRYYLFPQITHDIEKVTSMLCEGAPARNVEIHEEIFSILLVSEYCTVASGECALKE